MKKLLRALIPKPLLKLYHFKMAVFFNLFYGRPTRKLIVIGVTGTKGKTSTSNYIWSALQASGIKTGLISSANIRIGAREAVNDMHMTMPGRGKIQQLCKQMLKAGCTHVVIETASEGILQYRHVGIAYDIAVFTNLSPEHLPSHGGSFENYKETKGILFKQLLKQPTKTWNDERVEKVIIANSDDEHADYYLSFPADRHITFGIEGGKVHASSIQEHDRGVTFQVDQDMYTVSIPGKFNVYNALPAITIAKLFGSHPESIAEGIEKLHHIPGRMEEIDEGQDFRVFVDYAHEARSMKALLESAPSLAKGRVIVILGAEGGGRDTSKRKPMGELAGELADIVIVSNVDPYEDDPAMIAEDIAIAAESKGKIRDKDLFVIEDREAGIKKALELAKKDDLVLITGKGAEQSITIGGKSLPWDDRVITRKLLK